MAKFEDTLGREGFNEPGKPTETDGPKKQEPAKFADDSPFPAFRMIPAGSSPIEPELAKPTPMMKVLPIVVIAAILLFALILMIR